MNNTLHHIRPFTEDNNSSRINNPEPQVSLSIKAIRDAGMHQGNVNSFSLNLKELYHKMVNEWEAVKSGISEHEVQIENATNILEDKNVNQQQRIDDITNKHIPELKSKIKEVKNEIRDIKAHPEKYQDEKTDKVSYFISLALLLLISLYLWVFYSSAAYSAFFREIKFTSNAVFNSIFYSNAISEAYKNGITSLMFITLLPFIFLGLGFLVHTFFEKKTVSGYLGLGTLVLTTFFFDGLLAYEITQKIYEAKALNMFQEMPPFSTSMAVKDVNFWIILAAGFVVYLILGLVFHFFIEAKHKLDFIGLLLEKKASIEEELVNEIAEKEQERANLESSIHANKQEISEYKNSGKFFAENNNAIKQALTEYASGWAKYLTFAKFPESMIAEIESETKKIIKGEL